MRSDQLVSYQIQNHTYIQWHNKKQQKHTVHFHTDKQMHTHLVLELLMIYFFQIFQFLSIALKSICSFLLSSSWPLFLSPLPSCLFLSSPTSGFSYLSSPLFPPLFLLHSLISISYLCSLKCDVNTEQTHTHTGWCAISLAPLAVVVGVTGRLVKRIKLHLSVLSHFHQRDWLDCVYQCACVQIYTVCVHRVLYLLYCVCLQACAYETITLPCSQAERSSETRQGHITLQALISSTLMKRRGGKIWKRDRDRQRWKETAQEYFITQSWDSCWIFSVRETKVIYLSEQIWNG